MVFFLLSGCILLLIARGAGIIVNSSVQPDSEIIVPETHEKRRDPDLVRKFNEIVKEGRADECLLVFSR